MPTFVLKKYAPEPTSEDSQPTPQTPLQEEQETLTIEVNSSDSIAKIVAQALYKAMPNIEIVRKEAQDTSANEESAKVISAEEINANPVGTLQSLGGSQCVLILNNGFKTAQEEWFLQTLENKGIKTFYTLSGFANHVYGTLDRRVKEG